MKRNKQYIKSIILLLLSISLCTTKAQEWGQINRLNEQGQKEGFWISSDDYITTEQYYHHGVTYGIAKSYCKGKLNYISNLSNNEESNSEIYFDSYGRVERIMKNFDTNNCTAVKYNEKDYIPDYKCYCIFYYLNGRIAYESWLLWDEGDHPLSDTSFEYKPKNYDKNGNIVPANEQSKIEIHERQTKWKVYNEVNYNGRKEGFWKEKNTNLYYHNGVKHGFYTEFTETPPSSLPINGAEGEKSRITQKLAVFGEYTHGEMSGTWYFFNPIGQLTKTYKHFSRETNLINKPMSKDNFRQTHRCYRTEFYPDATVKEEGWIIWTDDPRSEFARKKGEWKTYSPEGKLIKTEFFN